MCDNGFPHKNPYIHHMCDNCDSHKTEFEYFLDINIGYMMS